jgi:predicted nucleic acid-binding protein
MMPELAVSNAGPLIVLSKLNLLHLLKELYREVIIPAAVYEETVINGMQYGFEDAYTLRLFLKQHNLIPQPFSNIPTSVSSAHLDKGETEALGLALSHNALLLMDEELGRTVAREHNLRVKGSLGILIEDYRKNMMTEGQIRFYLSQISHRKDIWINPKLCQKLLESIEGLK